MKGTFLFLLLVMAAGAVSGQERFSGALSAERIHMVQDYDAYATQLHQLSNHLNATFRRIAAEEQKKRRIEQELQSRMTPEVLAPLFFNETLKRGIDPARLLQTSLHKTSRTAQDGGISGTVLVEGQLPEDEVKIYVFDRHGYFAGSAAVDLSTGRYAVAPLPSDSFYVVARSNRYVDAIYKDVISPLASMASWRQAGKVFVPAAVVDNIDFNLRRGVRITGTVTDESGAVLEDGTVVNFRVTSDGDPAPLIERSVELIGGQYELIIPATGRFKILAAVEGYESRWSGNRADWTDAEVVAIDDLSAAPVMNFSLPQSPEMPVGQITGVVRPALFVLLAVFDAADTSFVRFGFSLGYGEVAYALSDLPPGNYFIYADDVLGTLIGGGNSMGEFYDGGAGSRSIIGAKPVEVRAGEPTVDINFDLDPGAVVSGKVTLADGTPLDSLTVLLVNADLLNGDGSFITRFEVDVVATDFDGSYEIPGLKPGNYYLRTFSDFFINYDLESPDDILTDGKHKGKVVDQYYGGEANLLGLLRAQKLKIDAPLELNNIDFVLPVACKISGRVTESETGAPVHQLYVAALEDSTGYPFYPWATVGDSGRYELRALPKGKYKLLALTGFSGKTDLLPEYYGGSRSFYTAQVVELNSERLEGIDFALKRGATIEGFVLLPDGRKLGADVQDGIPVVAYHAETGETASYDFVQFNGGFRIDRLFPGIYKLAVLPLPPFSTAYSGGGSAFDDAFSETIALQYGQVVGDKTIVLSEAGGMLRGVVADSLGNPLPRVMVAAYDRSGHMIAYAVTGIDSRTGKPLEDSGAFEMPNLKAGEYTVRTLALFMATSLLEQGLELIGGLTSVNPLNLLLGGDLGDLQLNWIFYRDQWYSNVPAEFALNLDKLLFQAASYGLANAEEEALTPVFLPIPFFEVVPENAVRVKVTEGVPAVVNFRLGRSKWREVVSSAENTMPLKDFVLYQNYPNPFNPQTRITFVLPRDGWVDIAVFDALGRRVGMPLRRYYTSGVHSMVWQAVPEDGKPLAAGIYFLQLKAFDDIKTIKMTLLK